MLSNEELLEVRGGANITQTLLNAIARIIGTIFNLGQSVGSSIRRVKSNSYCKIS